ncbi:MAG: VWA domain-containing protein [Armatimonadetes bacterium]|nr:VWA domain-containing protein [Armatimonadota bacterium]
MAFWILAALTMILAFLRFAPLRRHIGFTLATLVLILRLVAILVAILLASPLSLSSYQTVEQPSRIALLVDASDSVNFKAREQAIKAIVSSLGEHKGSVLAWEFSDSLKPLNLSNFTKLSGGKGSRLSRAILEAIETSRPNEILVLTDAQDTEPLAEEQILKTLKKSGTKLNAVILPNDLPPNLSLSLSPNQVFLFSGEEAKFSVRINGERVSEKAKAQMRVWERKRIVFKSSLPFFKGMAQTSVMLKPSSNGWNRYRFEVLPIKGEAWADDNYMEVLVWQSPTKLRALVVTGQPSFEFKFVKQAIQSEPNFEWVAIASLPEKTRYQQGSPQLMPTSLLRPEKFHVVIIVAPTADEFGFEEGRAIWQFAQEGGGVLLTLSEPTVRTKGWRFFVQRPLDFASLPSPSPLSLVKDDPLGNQLPNLPKVDAAWAITLLPTFAQSALQSLSEPVLVWWQEGWGKIAIVGFEGTWRWVMEAARKGEKPETHRKFWRTVVRFLADPMKGEKRKISSPEADLATPKPPPPELSFKPEPKRVEGWVKATNGQILKPEEIKAWVKNLAWAKTVKVPTKQPISAIPLPYFLLIAALTIEWLFIRRSGLN